MREKKLGSENETTAVGRSSLCFQVLLFGADSISEEVVGFSPFMVSLMINIVFIVSCV